MNERLAAVMPRARTELLRGAGHIPHITHTEEFARVIEAFVTEHARREGAEVGASRGGRG